MKEKSFRNRIKVNSNILKSVVNNDVKQQLYVKTEKENKAEEEITKTVLNILGEEINRITSDSNIDKETKLIQIDYLLDLCKFAKEHQEAVQILNNEINKTR